jgi:diguanylate cyclase (GGDEF)-like protein
MCRADGVQFVNVPASHVFALTVPLCTAVLAAAFAVCWLYVRRRRDLLWMAASFALFSIALTLQILDWPRGTGPNALLTSTVYLCGALCLAYCMGLRFQVRYSLWGGAVLALAVVAGIYHYAYVQSDLLLRIYLLNFGVGAVLLLPAWKLWAVRPHLRLHRALLWVYYLFCASFFVRTVLTAPWGQPMSLESFGQSPFWITLHLSMLVFALVFAILLLGTTLTDLVDSLRHERNLDPLTQLLNRRGFGEQARALLQGVEPGGHFTIMVCDIDWFKSINDRHGHAKGDEVLSTLGRVLRNSMRSGDPVARFGGEEFVALLAAATPAEALHVVERIRAELRQWPVVFTGQALRVSMSFGVTQLGPQETLKEGLARADRLLYLAKERGRNRVEHDLPGLPPTEAPVNQPADPLVAAWGERRRAG